MGLLVLLIKKKKNLRMESSGRTILLEFKRKTLRAGKLYASAAMEKGGERRESHDV